MSRFLAFVIPCGPHAAQQTATLTALGEAVPTGARVGHPSGTEVWRVPWLAYLPGAVLARHDVSANCAPRQKPTTQAGQPQSEAK